jgi:protease PrsW
LVDLTVALLPVVAFLVTLLYMDSFKLVAWRAVLAALLCGGLAAVGASVLNASLSDTFRLPLHVLSRYIAPLGEEGLKAVYVLYLLRRGRVGFLVDAAILGFAVGAGFAMAENLEYLRALSERHLLLWIVRGFGTAVLHGGTTAIFAIVTKALYDRHAGQPWAWATFGPGLMLAVVLHSLFNHFLLPAVASTLVLLIVLPVLMIAVFERSERGTRDWMGVGLDTDLEVLESIVSGSILKGRVGAYLESLKAHLPGPVLADMLCLLRIQLELGIQAKGLLLAREAGLHLPVGEDVRANLQELRYLEAAIGRTGLLAMKPILRRTSRELWHVYLLEGG